MNRQFKKDVSQIFNSHFLGNVLLKLTNVYFVVAGNAAQSLIFWIRFLKATRHYRFYGASLNRTLTAIFMHLPLALAAIFKAKVGRQCCQKVNSSPNGTSIQVAKTTHEISSK